MRKDGATEETLGSVGCDVTFGRNTALLVFDTPEGAAMFRAWWLDGGGEDAFGLVLATDDEQDGEE